MQKVSFFTASLSAWFFLTALTVFVCRPGIERDLTVRSRFALDKAGIPARVSFSGRDARLELNEEIGDAFSAVAKRARHTVEAVFGVRAAEVVRAMPTSRATKLISPPPPAMSAPAPAPVTPAAPPRAAPAEPHAELEAPVAAAVVASNPPTGLTDARALAHALAELTLRFRFDSTKLAAPSSEQLEKISALLKQYQTQRVRVVGYTDSSGQRRYNRKLSKRRAQAVADFLSAQGISSERLESVGRGATHFCADNSSRAGRKQNRRVEFEVVDSVPSEGMG